MWHTTDNESTCCYVLARSHAGTFKVFLIGKEQIAMIFDTHTHYDDRAFDDDRDVLIAGLPSAGVGRFCNIGSTMDGARMSVKIAESYDHAFAAVGVHPDEVYDFYPGSRDNAASIEKSFADHEYGAEGEVFEELKSLAGGKRVVAVGEIGLDYHGYDIYEIKPGKEIQKYWFKKQLDLAIEIGKPVVIHSRNASEDTMDMMREAHAAGLRNAVIHCYSYSRETALQYVDMGFYLGIGGVITYAGQKKLTKTLEAVPMERVLLETDCPYLTPAPARADHGWERNSSLYLPYVIEKIAEIKGMVPREVEQITWDNANRFFGI